MRPLLLGLTVVALVAGCSNDDVASRATNPDGTSAIQIRPVLGACTTVEPATETSVAGQTTLPAQEAGWVQLAGTDQWCQVGPTQADGTVFDSADVQNDPVDGWIVTASLRPGPTGQDLWNDVAAQCFDKAATCPSGQLSIVVDGLAISVASVEIPEFQGSIQISGTFTEAQARAIAGLINAGSV
ncbi:MAG: hypothetical protein ABMA25_16985 [Ilumatobacteraceae bacterium]